MKLIKIFILMIIVLLSGSCKKIDPFQITDNVVPRDFLSNEEYEKLVIEIVYVEGHEPTPEAVSHLVAQLSNRLQKPHGFSVFKSEIDSPGYSSYSVEQIEELEKKHREYYPKKEALAAFIFVADAGYSGDNGSSKALGIAYAPTSFAIFEKTIRDYSDGIGQPPLKTLEATALLHEFGHLLGLVNYGTSMVDHHQDVSNGHHCTDQNCIMYYAGETTDIIGFITGGSMPEFDAKCIADMKNNGGK